MTKQYVITEAQNKEVIDHLECGFDDDSNGMTVLMLQSLPELTAEPVAWMNTDDLCADTAFRWCKLDEFTSPVYTSPQLLQDPIDKLTAMKCAEICRSRSRSIEADGHNTSAANEASKCALAIDAHWRTYPLQPITAEDVTDEMLKDIFPKSASALAGEISANSRVRKDIADVFNMVIKHRGEKT